MSLELTKRKETIVTVEEDLLVSEFTSAKEEKRQSSSMLLRLSGIEMHGAFTWNELVTTDPERSCAFFAETLGWTFEECRLPQYWYWLAKSGGRYVAGICAFGPNDGDLPPPPSHWVGFIEVDDIDMRIERARTAGATILRPPHDVVGVGRVSLLREPTGAFMGWMTSAQPSD